MSRLSGRLWVYLAGVAVAAVAVVAFVASGSLGPGGTPAQRLHSWVQGSGLGQSIGTLTADDAHITEVVNKDLGTKTVHTVCAVLTNDAQAANDNLPAPDTKVTQTLARAYGLEYDAGSACYDAGGTNRALLDQSAHDRARAQRLLDQVLVRIRAVTGKTVPTTTTTVPGTPTVTAVF